MLVSLIIPTYKDVEALSLILDALVIQTYTDFEVIVAEDDNSLEVAHYLKKYNFPFVVKHFSHEDKGLRKAIAVNSAVRMSEGEYLIYIDGDTIPYTTFIEAHVLLSKKKQVLCGRRVNLGAKVSSLLRKGEIKVQEIEKNYLTMYAFLHDDNIRHYNKGIYLRPNTLLQKIIALFDANVHILASNFSCYKVDMLTINGSDEAMPGGPGVDDTDVEWRMQAIGITLRSCKYSANLLHLDHPRSDRRDALAHNMQLIQDKKDKNEYIAQVGINKEVGYK
jgi:glycosyltransferase involved in cell wall biosynthesis